MRISDWSSDVCSSDLCVESSTNSADGALPGSLQCAPEEASARNSNRRLSPILFTPHLRAACGGCHEPGKRPGRTWTIPSRSPGTTPPDGATGQFQIGRAHVGTPVTNAHLVCRLLL